VTTSNNNSRNNEKNKEQNKYERDSGLETKIMGGVTPDRQASGRTLTGAVNNRKGK